MNMSIFSRFGAREKFAAVVCLQILIIFILIAFKLVVLTGGTEIMLRLMPVDPRDPFRGDYVTFQYEGLSTIESVYFNDKNVQEGETVYVPLRKSGKVWTLDYYAGGVQRSFPDEPNTTFIKARIASINYTDYEWDDSLDINIPYDDSYRRPNTSRTFTATLSYGIEEYFIPEGSGWNMNTQNGPVYAQVALDQRGNAVLKKLYTETGPWQPK